MNRNDSKEFIKNHKPLILIVSAWVIIAALLVGFGIGSVSKSEPGYAGEEALVQVEKNASATGMAADAALTPDEDEADDTVLTPGGDTADESLGTTGEADNGSADDGSPKQGMTSGQSSKTIKDKGSSSGDVKPRKSHTPSPGATKTPAPSSNGATREYSFKIECLRILDKPELWRDGLDDVIPENGIFFSGKRRYKKGESVFDALSSICDKEGILLDSKYTPIYDTWYVSGIGNLYEFDCGGQSGWKYSVNGVLPGVGCSKYEIAPGDEIVFFYDYVI
ncbi:MAG TPA: hypothetical protein DCP06_01120 [Lachnospiraceae bacterium]|nr:hypothetical protein [Lachnospiraceae bacterium]